MICFGGFYYRERLFFVDFRRYLYCGMAAFSRIFLAVLRFLIDPNMVTVSPFIELNFERWNPRISVELKAI